MNTVAAPTPLHQAALAVHAMDPDDAAWLMAALPAAQGQALAPMLEELTTLGVPRGLQCAALLEAAKGRAPQATDAEVERVQALGRLLAAEPGSVVHLLLRLENWAWRDQVAAVLGVELRHSAARVPSALADALTAACDELWTATPPTQCVPVGRWERLRTSVAAWRRQP